jgi:hypothetical protein
MSSHDRSDRLCERADRTSSALSPLFFLAFAFSTTIALSPVTADSRRVTDVGLTGPDKGAGGDCLFVPPGYAGALPGTGYHVVKPRTNRMLMFYRAFVEKGDVASAVYDNQNRSPLATDPKLAGLDSALPGIQMNPDGGVTVWFPREPPPGDEKNWEQTVPGKGYDAALRLDGPLEPWFDQTWRPGDRTPAAGKRVER